MTTDQTTLALIEKVKAKKAEIKSLERPNYHTNMTFSLTEGRQADGVNINVLKLPEVLKIGGFLESQRAGHTAFAKALGIENPPEFTWQGFTFDQWMSDLKVRAEVWSLAAKRKELDVIEQRLNAVISPELRREMELEALAKELE